METRVEERADPLKLWPKVKSIIMLGMSYAPNFDPLDILEKPELGAISIYARSRDYHDVLKGRLKQIAQSLVHNASFEVNKSSERVLKRPVPIEKNADPLNVFDQSTSQPAVKVFVDTAPVMEKALAAASGLGWQGKHTVLVSREHGSWLFWGRFSRRWNCRRTSRKKTIAGVAPSAFRSARPMPSPRPINSTPANALPISPSSIRGRLIARFVR